MKHTSKILALLFVALMILTSLTALSVSAEGESAATPTTLFFKPNSWTVDDARFAAYFFNDSNGKNTWVSMTAIEDGVYLVKVPEGYPNVIFCRMNGTTTENVWDNRWNQTDNLTIPTDEKNYFVIPVDMWKNVNDTYWSEDTYTHTHSYNQTVVAPTCTDKGYTSNTCVCGDSYTDNETEATGHKLVEYAKDLTAYSKFTTVFPTAKTKGYTTATCANCGKDVFKYDEVSVMTPGTYVLDAKDLDGIAKKDYINGQVKVVNGVFAAHLSSTYKTESSSNTTFTDGWKSTNRMNFGGKSEIISKSGAYKNYVEITTTSNTTVTVWWRSGGDGRQVALFDKDGKTVKSTTDSVKDTYYMTSFEVEAGTYFIGNATTSGGNYFYKIQVVVAEPTSAHDHDYADATCTTPKTCKTCGATEGEALGHDWADATCTTPKTCKTCKTTEGEALGHQWGDANCTVAKTCKVCNATEGEALGHNYDAGVCTRCGDLEEKPDEKPGDETPGGSTGDETPGEENPGEENPGEEAPGETPDDEKPGEETPDVDVTPDEPTEEPTLIQKVVVIIKGLVARLVALFKSLVAKTIAVFKK